MFNDLNKFLLLGLFDWIGSIIGAALKGIFDLFQPILKNLIEWSIKIVVGIFNMVSGELFNNIAMIVYTFVDAMINSIFHRLPGEGENSIAGKIIKSTISNVNTIFKTITCEEAIKRLNLHPKIYLSEALDFEKGELQFEGDSRGVDVGELIKNYKPKGDNPYTIIEDIIKDVVQPSAMVIFSLIIMVELFQLTTRTEGMRNSGFEAPFKLMLKVAVCKIFLDRTKEVLEAIIQFTFEMFQGLYDKMHSADYNLDPGTVNREKLINMHYMAILSMWISVWILCGLITLIIKYILPFVVLARVLEIYMMIALAPLPFATFANQEFSQVGKNFIKQFIGVCFKSFVIYLIIIIYSSVFCCLILRNDMISQFADLIAGNAATAVGFFGLMAPVILFLITTCLKPTIFAFMLMGTIFSADRYTKMITGAFY